VFDSELGWFALLLSDRGVRQLTFGHETPADAIRALGPSAAESHDVDAREVPLARRLQRYAEGNRDEFLDVKIDVTAGGAFGQKILDRCRRIPHGATSTYGALAAEAGSPQAARAVGNAMARNRVPIIVPCHRVLGSGGSWGGYSMSPGLPLKKLLLRLEGAGEAHRHAGDKDFPVKRSKSRRTSGLGLNGPVCDNGASPKKPR
jgi:methylated-DNA-[protein]-cysteine S-methyltransferase